MAQITLNVPELTDAEMTTIRTSLAAVKTILAPKFINLEPEDRQKYGSIKEENKLIINKVKDYRDNMPALSHADINWVNYAKNVKTRTNYTMLVNLLKEIQELCDDPRTLVDYNLFGDASRDYKFTKYKAEEDGGSTAGFEAKYEDLKQFFV